MCWTPPFPHDLLRTRLRERNAENEEDLSPAENSPREAAVGGICRAFVPRPLRFPSSLPRSDEATGARTEGELARLRATLDELLTLQPVFNGINKHTLLRPIALEEPRSPRQLKRGRPVELATILLKTLAKSPDERYAIAGPLAHDLRRFLEQKPILARRPSLLDRLGK